MLNFDIVKKFIKKEEMINNTKIDPIIYDKLL